jgi:hypothetical protein
VSTAILTPILSAIFGYYRRPPHKSTLKHHSLKFLKKPRWAGLAAGKANQAPNLRDFKRSKANVRGDPKRPDSNILT